MKIPEPSVSVILPTRNRSRMLPRSVGSVLRQTHRDFELLVVDDGSSEDIESVVRGFSDGRLRYVRRERTGGVAAARNTGVQAARGRYLAFQDSDDEWLSHKLEQQVEAMEASDRRMVICGLLRVLGPRVRRYPSVPTLHYQQVLAHPIAYTQSWLVPRAAVVAAGGFDESLRVWDDWELLIRLAARLEVHILPEPLVVSPASDDGISREQERFIHDMDRILAKHATDLLAMPGALAQLKYLQGRLLGLAGRGAEARRALAQALRLRPLHWRTAVLLGLSMAGGRIVQGVLERADNA